ncbi:MAG: hypothetical protein O9308_17415 [Beijerinckiaceae bacterium]|jgi:hypothetical protein|nr:hypothetical protein [Beijerinckiaceae bacterium]
MMLSHILRDLTDDRLAEEALIGLGDLVLLAAIDTEAALFEETRGDYVAGAVRRFARLANDEDWLAVMGRLERGERPAEVFLTFVLHWALKRDSEERNPHPSCQPACSCGEDHHHGQAPR